MPAPEKSKLMQFAKKRAAPPPVASKLQAKRAAAKAPPAPPAPPKTGASEAEGADDTEVFPHELLEEAAEAAEKGEDTELEDALADAKSSGPDDVPAFAADAEKWKLAAETVGLGADGENGLYEEPLAVAAYLYKKLGGTVTGGHAGAPVAEGGENGEDMDKPGSAAKAMATASRMRKEGALIDAAIQEAQENPDPELLAKTTGYDPERDGNPPSWAVDESTWERAKDAVDPEGDGATYAEPWAVVAHVYKAMGGTIG